MDSYWSPHLQSRLVLDNHSNTQKSKSNRIIRIFSEKFTMFPGSHPLSVSASLSQVLTMIPVISLTNLFTVTLGICVIFYSLYRVSSFSLQHMLNVLPQRIPADIIFIHQILLFRWDHVPSIINVLTNVILQLR